LRIALAIMGIVAMARWAHAQPAAGDAEALFRQGKQLMVAGKLAEACAAFDASQKLDPKVTTLLNQANCREKIDQLATALGLFLEGERLTRGATDKASRQMNAIAIERAGKLQPRLSTLLVSVPAGSRIEGLEILRSTEVLAPESWNRALPIDGGTYRIVARAPGYDEWSSTVQVAVERATVTLEIPRLRATEPARSGPGVGSSTQGAPAPLAAEEPRRSRALWSTRRKLSAAAVGGGAIALIAGSVLGVSAKHQQREAHALCPDPQLGCDDADLANEIIRSGHGRAIGANVAFGVGAAAVIAAGVLWLTGAPESGRLARARRGAGIPGARRVVIVPIAAPEQLLVTASGSF